MNKLNNTHINWDILADEKINENNAKYIDELVTVTSLDNNTNSLIEKLNNYKKNIINPLAGIGNLTHVNLGIHLTAFSIDNMKSVGDIYTVDALGNIVIYNNKTFHKRFVEDSQKESFNFNKIKVFDLGLITKLSGISNFTYFEDAGNTMNDISWKKIDLNTNSGNKVVDFTGFSSVIFFALDNGGILRQSGKHIENQSFPDQNNTIFANIKFQALALDNKNKILYALDRGGKTIQPNGLYLFYLNDDLDFIKNNFQVIKSNSKIYFNNLLVVQNKYNNIINSGNKQLILVGTQLNDKNEAIKPGYVNLYSAHLEYGSKNSKLNIEAAQYPKCKAKDGIVYAMCNNTEVFEWGLGPTTTKESDGKIINDVYGEEININKNIDECNDVARVIKQWGNCEKYIYKPDRSATLVLTKLLKNDFTGNDIIFNRTKSSNHIFNLVAENLENFYKQSDSYDIDRFINMDMNINTGDIYILLNGLLLKYPINNLGSNQDVRTYEDLITSPDELINLEREIDALYNNYQNLVNTENKLDNKLLLNRNNILIKKIENLKKEVKRLNEIEFQNETFSQAVKTSKMENTVNSLQYLVWIILSIITIIIIVINFVRPDVIPIPIVIIYIIFVSAILIINRSFFKKI